LLLGGDLGLLDRCWGLGSLSILGSICLDGGVDLGILLCELWLGADNLASSVLLLDWGGSGLVDSLGLGLLENALLGGVGSWLASRVNLHDSWLFGDDWR